MRATLAVAAALAALVLAIAFGSVPMGASELGAALIGRGDPVNVEIVWTLRMPRALAAFAVGGLLALSGGLLQAVLRNPLADPYLLGVSGGASVGALLAMLASLGAAAVTAGALGGATIVAAGLIAATFRRSGWDPHRLILAGIAFASACGAVTSVILSAAPATQLPGMLFWLIGDLSAAESPQLGLVILAAAVLLSIAIGPRLDALALGPEKARTLGVPVTETQAMALGGATAATVGAVLLAGSVGFVGLVVPHWLRLVGVHRNRQLLPLALLWGGVLVTAADTLARTVVRPIEIPVGAVTALLGVPVLLWLLWRSR